MAKGKKGAAAGEAAGATRTARLGSEKGFLIKGADQKLYYISRNDLAAMQAPKEIQAALAEGEQVIDIDEFLLNPPIGIWPCKR
ncbi:MAG TPA: hypothetical protein VFO41_08075 [Alphaproteobacteria bacterium]|nr:hypothetical protein [Alphaproteobacteria bacterium]